MSLVHSPALNLVDLYSPPNLQELLFLDAFMQRFNRQLMFVYQNLIALILRPLRLCIPPDQLRRMRIILLKTTHAPFVGAIRLYEGSMTMLKGASAQRESSKSSLKGPSTMSSRLIKRHSSMPMKRPLTAPSQTDNGTMTHKNTAESASRNTASEAMSHAMDTDETQRMLRALVAKVDHLTALVEQNQGLVDNAERQVGE
jgi:hypothetical protein